MESKKRYVYSFWILLCVGTGLASGVLSRNGQMVFSVSVTQPPLSPPPWLFPVVWGLLYVLMGIGAARVWMSDGSLQRQKGLNLFVAQLVVNFFWSLIFFNLQCYPLAFLWLLLLLGLVFWMVITFWNIDPIAAGLQIPYLIWLTFASYLSLGVWLLNP